MKASAAPAASRHSKTGGGVAGPSDGVGGAISWVDSADGGVADAWPGV